MSNEKQNSNVVVVKSTKNVGLAVALALFFGPLGMFYSTVLGAIIWGVVSLVVGILTLGFGLLITNPLGAVWAGIAASMYNKKLTNGNA